MGLQDQEQGKGLPQRQGKRLEDWLDQRLPRKVLLFLGQVKDKDLPSLRQIFQTQERWKHILFCSRFDGLLKDLRRWEPRWSFCNGEIAMTRLLALSSLGLASLISISSDVLFIHTSQVSLKVKELQALVQEGHRQNKLVFIGPVSRPLDEVQGDGWTLGLE